MGQYAGMKGLITKNSGDLKTTPGLDYLGWWWVIFLHCVNHLLELGLKDLRNVEPYIQLFDDQLQNFSKSTIIHQL